MLTNDAFDGKVDGIYPTATYGEAVKHLPTDVQSYSSIAQVITQARQDALQQAGKGVKPDPARCGFVLGSAGSGAGTTGNANGNGNGNDKGPIPGVIDSVGSGSADSFPVALIVIAVIAVVLLLGGGAGFLLRRRQRQQQELEQASGASTDSDDGTRELTP